MIYQTVVLLALVMGCMSIQNPLKVVVYYESWNQDSADFIVDHLYKVWSEFKDFLQLFMIPIAVVQQSYHNGHMSFKCHGGPSGCQVNSLHVCAYHVACRGMEQISCPTEQMTAVLDYTVCMMSSNNQREAAKGCARKGWLSSKEINDCAVGWVGETLQSFYGNMTIDGLSLARMELPYIEIDTDYEFSQEYARTNLRTLICGLLPDVCWISIEECDKKS